MGRYRSALMVGAIVLVAILVAACGSPGQGTATQERLRIELTSPTVRGAVTEAETTVTGVVSVPAARVTVNDTAVTVGADGAFTQTVPLAYGSNRLVVRADSEGMTTASRTLTITRSLTLSVSEPADGTAVAQNPVAVVGRVSDPEARVTIVGIPVEVQADGTFSHNLPLHYPSTIISVAASVGNTAPIAQTFTVNYSGAR